MTSRGPVLFALLLAGGVGAGAGGGCARHDSSPAFTREALLDPATCGRCHEEHFRQWSGSMHAYAGEDPVFVAMNRRLQRETNGQIGDLCVRCHAPMAVRDEKTKDGLNLAELPAGYRGVTCFFCHTVESVGEVHDNGLVNAPSTTMRGPFGDALANDAHGSALSTLHDQRKLDSSTMCGSCHDIVTPQGAHIERTFAEWKQSLFATETGQTCGTCHMPPSATVGPIANVPGAFGRVSHAHSFAGVDRALTPWPNVDEQKREIQDLVDASIQSALCVSRRGESAQIRVVLDNVFAGHSFPSGASADRRVWVEVVASKDAKVVYQSGVVEDGKPVLEGSEDPDLWLLRDVHFDRAGKETHLFGLAACYESRVLPFPVTANPADPRFYQRNIVRDYRADGTFVPLPDTVTMRLRMIAIGLEVLDDLVASGDLDPSIRSRMETVQVGPTVTWKAGAGQPFTEPQTGATYECVTVTNQNFRANKYPPSATNTCSH